MRKIAVAAVCLLTIFVVVRSNLDIQNRKAGQDSKQATASKNITNTIEKGESLFDIFKKHGLDIAELFSMREASAGIHRLRDLSPGQPYRITVDESSRVTDFQYWINDDAILNITRTGSGYVAKKTEVAYEKRMLHIGSKIQDNLVSSIGEGRENLLLALQMSDIFAWDIDFTSDIRNNDTFKVVVEGLYLDGQFRKYGNILSAEFANNGKEFAAYRFDVEGSPDYYDENGDALKKAFLKAPLNFRRISSSFSRGRFHPILKINRPHHGIDYAAPSGTPVSAVGDGIVTFAGHRGQYGKLVVIKHPNGYQTYYGHLLRFGKKIGKGRQVKQGEVIGMVGATGLATGPHLHYEVRVNNRPINPARIVQTRAASVPKGLMADFRQRRSELDRSLASIQPGRMADSGEAIRIRPGS